MKQTSQELAKKSLKNGSPTAWFEQLYAQSDTSGDGVPWARMQPNPYLVQWLDEEHVVGNGRKTLVVGCGLGDDANELAERGFNVTAFDVSQSAIEICKTRFPESDIDFQQADLFAPPTSCHEHFDFVFESITVQSLPPDYQETAMRRISSFVKQGGQLLVLTWVRSPDTPLTGPPWRLLPSAFETYVEAGLTQHTKQHYPSTGHMLAVYQR